MIRRRRTLREAVFGEDLVGLDLAGGAYFSFNSTARRVWELLEQPRSTEALCTLLAEEFETDAAGARAGLEPLIEMLKAEGLVEVDTQR
jgi:hypothetical protein